jgi:predicted RNase H-like HicB family nuclease
MTVYRLEVVVEREDEDEGYFAYSPMLPGCYSNGKTVEEAERNLLEAVQQHVETLRAHDRRTSSARTCTAT